MIKVYTFQLIWFTVLVAVGYHWAACALFEVGSDVGSFEPNSEAPISLHQLGMET